MIASSFLAISLAASPTATASPHGHNEFGPSRVPTRAAFPDDPVPGGTPAEAARGFADAAREALGLTAGSDLALAAVADTPLGPAVRFEQRHAGLSVFGADLVVSLGHDRRVRHVSHGLRRIETVQPMRVGTPGQAVAAAARGIDGVPVRDGRPVGAARPVLIVEGTAARIAWEVALAHLSPLANFYALVDDRTGERLALVNRVFRQAADGGTADAGTAIRTDDARVFTPSPGGAGTAPTSLVTLSGLADPRDSNGYLVGGHLKTANCCYHQNCDPQQPAPRYQGVFSFGTFVQAYDMVVCERRPRATNVLLGRSDYVYAAAPAPTLAPGRDPADEDPFAEVHAYHHAETAHAWFTSLVGPTFALRDARRNPPVLPVAWVNVLGPNLRTAKNTPFGLRIDDYERVDNAAFVPRELWAQLVFPDVYKFDSDSFVFFQGPKADFAYDGSLVYHELAHAVVWGLAPFQGLKVDARGALSEAGALHEAFSDYFAAVIAGGPLLYEYVGNRLTGLTGPFPGEGAVRDLSNALTCPAVLEGEPHQDARHVAAALWASRQKLLGADAGKSFDGVVYAAIAGLSVAAGFADAVTAVANGAQTRFGGTAGADVRAEFTQRGVTGCSRVLDYTGPRPVYGIEGTDQVGAPRPFVPGPIQFKLALPQGATEVVIIATYARTFFGSAPRARVLAKFGGPITFTVSGTTITHDADFDSIGSFSSTTLNASIDVSAVAACDTVLYFTVANEGTLWLKLTDLTAIVTPRTSCGGPSDAGSPQADAGPPSPEDAGQPAAADAGDKPPPPPGGCGCGAAPSAAVLAAIASAAALRRRRAHPSR